MNKILMTLGAALMVMATLSCKKLLDIKPVNSMVPVSVKDYESVLLGGYPRTDFFFNTELMTDNAYANLNAGMSPSRTQEPWFVWASSMLLDGAEQDPYWGQLYKSIFYANTVLDNFANRTPAPQEKALYERVKGEAHALRAFCYFYLINLYAEPYSLQTIDAPGVPMPLTADDVNGNAGNNVREPVGKVWNQIVSDIDAASNLLIGKVNTDRYRFDYYSVELLKARVHLFMLDYQTAIEAAANVMSVAKLSDMNSMQAYLDDQGNTYAFTGNVGVIDMDYNKEIMFFTGGRANFNLFYYSRAVFKPSVELLDLTKRYGYLTDYRQFIFESFAIPNTSEGIQTGPTMYNMYAKQEKDWYYIGLKASEAYVIRAEAYTRMNQPEKAIADLNELLRNRIKKDIFVPLKTSDFIDGNALLSRVLEERRVETAFDAGLRWFDLRRLGKPEINHVYKNGTVYTLKKDDPRYLLQIPPSEANNSPEMPLNPR